MVNTYFSTAGLWYFCENGEKCILKQICGYMKYTVALHRVGFTKGASEILDSDRGSFLN